jgi:hypothetical protein
MVLDSLEEDGVAAFTIVCPEANNTHNTVAIPEWHYTMVSFHNDPKILVRPSLRMSKVTSYSNESANHTYRWLGVLS